MTGSNATTPNRGAINLEEFMQKVDNVLDSYREKTGVGIRWYYQETRRRRPILLCVSIPETDKNRAYMVAANVVKWLKDHGLDAEIAKPLETWAYVQWCVYVEIKVRT